MTSNGQISLPARVRRRWTVASVLVVDRGDHVLIRPLTDDPLAGLWGTYVDGPSTEMVRAEERKRDAEDEERAGWLDPGDR